MNWLQTKIANYVFGKKGMPQDFFFNNTGTSSASSNYNNTTDYLNAYQTTNYIAKCVSRIASDVASLKWRIVDLYEDEVKDDRIAKIITEPVTGMTGRLFRQIIIEHLLLDGNAFILKEATNMLAEYEKRFDKLLVINPSIIHCYDKDNSQVTSTSVSMSPCATMYDINGRKLPREAIHQIITVGPHNSVRGMGVVQQNAGVLDADRFSRMYNNNFFNKGISSNLVISTKDRLGPQEWSNLKTRWQAEYSGSKNWSSPIFVDDSITVTPLGLTHKDIEFMEQRAFNRKDIRSFFNIPPIIIGDVDDAKYDTAEDQRRHYYENTISDWANLLSESLTLLFKQINPNVAIQFIVPQIVSKSEVNNAFDRGTLTPNQYNAVLGYPTDPDDEHMNTRYMSFNYIPATFINASNESTEKPADKQACGCLDTKKEADANNIGAPISETQYRLHRLAVNTKKATTRLIFKSIQQFYEGMNSRLNANLEKVYTAYQTKDDIGNINIDIDSLIDWAEEVAEATKQSQRFFTAGVASGINDINNFFKTEIDNSFKNPAIKLSVEKLSRNYVNQTLNTRRDDLRRLVATAIDKGQSVQDLKQSIQKEFEALVSGPKEAWKAMRIARTEASNAWDQAGLAGYREMNVEFVDVIGCEDMETDCNARNVPIADADNLIFHPNHTGTIVPAGV